MSSTLMRARSCGRARLLRHPTETAGPHFARPPDLSRQLSRWRNGLPTAGARPPAGRQSKIIKHLRRRGRMPRHAACGQPLRQWHDSCATVTHVVTGVEVAARRRLSGWLLRFYSERRQRSGSSLLALLPKSSLIPLHRNLLDPVDELGQLRDKEPVSRLKVPFGVRAWLVTGYDESKAVLAGADAFSNDFRHVVTTAGIPTGHHSPGGLGFADPPDHTRLRRLLTPEFTVRRLSRLGPQIEATIEGQLDEMAKIAERDGSVDLHEHFALPIPSLVICDLLGIPYEDRADFQRLSAARFD